MDTAGTRTGDARSGRPWPLAGRLLFGTHVLLVALAVAYTVWSVAVESVGANIGLGIGLSAVGLLGVPWSLLSLLDGKFNLDSGSFIAVAGAGVLLNLALHALLWSWVARRAAAR